MKSFKILGVVGVLFVAHPAIAYNYTLDSSYEEQGDADYIYFCNSTTCYSCGELQASYYANNVVVVEDEQTVRLSNNTYLCVEDVGYWINLGNTSTVPVKGSCSSKTEWQSLGSNKYCSATLNGTWNRFLTSSGEPCSSGIAYYSSCSGACEYEGSCSTFTHCGKGYYKNGMTCVACPDGGTTSGYTNAGITECYLPSGTSGSDESGSWQITGGNCYYQQ